MSESPFVIRFSYAGTDRDFHLPFAGCRHFTANHITVFLAWNRHQGINDIVHENRIFSVLRNHARPYAVPAERKLSAVKILLLRRGNIAQACEFPVADRASADYRAPETGLLMRRRAVRRTAFRDLRRLKIAAVPVEVHPPDLPVFDFPPHRSNGDFYFNHITVFQNFCPDLRVGLIGDIPDFCIVNRSKRIHGNMMVIAVRRHILLSIIHSHGDSLWMFLRGFRCKNVPAADFYIGERRDFFSAFTESCIAQIGHQRLRSTCTGDCAI